MSLELDADLFFGAIEVCLSNCFGQADDRDGDGEPRNDGLEDPIPIQSRKSCSMVFECFKEVEGMNKNPACLSGKPREPTENGV